MISTLRKLKDFAYTSAKVGISVAFIQEYIGGFVVCHGPSMEPTVMSSDIILTDHISPRIGRIYRGDIVIARTPSNFQCVCKRVVALPGELVEFKGCTIKIPAESYWLEGDNKSNSSDSRDYGPVPQCLIRRRCCWKIWPTFNPNFGNEMHFSAAAAAAEETNGPYS